VGVVGWLQSGVLLVDDCLGERVSSVLANFPGQRTALVHYWTVLNVLGTDCKATQKLRISTVNRPRRQPTVRT
jgi:hypothetical protein